MSAIRGNKSELAYKDKLLKETIRGRMIAERTTIPIMAHRLGMSERTFARRMERPRDFTLCELRKLCAEMGWSADTIKQLLF